MAVMGRYCKAYPANNFSEFPGWSANLQKEKEVNGNEGEASTQPTGDAYLFLQEDYTVTDGIFKDENVVFNNVTPGWVDFCQNTLKFEIPEDAA
jgi:hypothetical protein